MLSVGDHDVSSVLTPRRVLTFNEVNKRVQTSN